MDQLQEQYVFIIITEAGFNVANAVNLQYQLVQAEYNLVFKLLAAQVKCKTVVVLLVSVHQDLFYKLFYVFVLVINLQFVQVVLIVVTHIVADIRFINQNLHLYVDVHLLPVQIHKFVYMFQPYVQTDVGK